jgi:PncC family amidohydrolase
MPYDFIPPPRLEDRPLVLGHRGASAVAPENTLAAFARAMAVGVRKTARSDFGLSVTGIAGPDGGTVRKPVGLVYIALAHAKGVAVSRTLCWGGRAQVKFQSSQKALDVLRKFLIKRTRKAL